MRSLFVVLLAVGLICSCGQSPSEPSPEQKANVQWHAQQSQLYWRLQKERQEREARAKNQLPPAKISR